MNEEHVMEENHYAGLALAEEELVAQVAWRYYHDGLIQSDIGERLGLPRLKVSRLLEESRQSGVIHVQINSRYKGCLALESEFQQRLGLKVARVLLALNLLPTGTQLGTDTVQSLTGILQSGQLLAVEFSEATMSYLQYLNGLTGSQQVRLVTLSGGVGPYITGVGQLDAVCSVSIIPASPWALPAEIAETLRRESSVHDAILAVMVADAVVVGIGTIDQRRDVMILRSGYVSEGGRLIYAYRDVTGDILGYFLQAGDRPVEGLEIHRELFGVILDELAQLPTTVDVAGGEEKVQAIYVVLTGKRINGLITGETTARAILTLAS